MISDSLKSWRAILHIITANMFYYPPKLHQDMKCQQGHHQVGLTEITRSGLAATQSQSKFTEKPADHLQTDSQSAHRFRQRTPKISKRSYPVQFRHRPQH